jgi:predicted enzyme related to lactoylglutathione lyase
MEPRVSVGWMEVTVDCHDPARLARFWCDLLNVELAEPPFPGWERTRSTVPGGPVLNFQPVSDPKRGKSRIHLDLWTSDLRATVAWVTDHGGSFPGEVHVYADGTVAVLCDPEGTEFCVVGPPGSSPRT